MGGRGKSGTGEREGEEEREGEMHSSSRSGFPKLCFHTGVTQPGSECNHVIQLGPRQ